ncbi:bifunctional nuclease family protein [Halobium salinum]|uniref:Bifunctional nuclease family protein n=1 Tax=Halobium salinum TaxID=1364940 RepID=A0ABD5P6T9_9EURY|nr:bifunctional nuclease family protein [Halobium salinum]
MDHTAQVEGIAVGVGPDGAGVPAVVLAARDEYLPIFVTQDQARAIQLGLSGEPFERPLTHDLLVDVVTEFGGAIDGVRIDDLSEGTFFAKLDIVRYVEGESEKFVFDARPSDAVAVAVRADCGITVSDTVLDAAGRPPSEVDFDPEDGGQGGPGGPHLDDPDEGDWSGFR